MSFADMVKGFLLFRVIPISIHFAVFLFSKINFLFILSIIFFSVLLRFINRKYQKNHKAYPKFFHYLHCIYSPIKEQDFKVKYDLSIMEKVKGFLLFRGLSIISYIAIFLVTKNIVLVIVFMLIKNEFLGIFYEKYKQKPKSYPRYFYYLALIAKNSIESNGGYIFSRSGDDYVDRHYVRCGSPSHYSR